MQRYYTIEITYNHPETGAVEVYRMKNWKTEQVMKFRGNVWYEGFFLPVDESLTEGYLVGPQLIKFIYIIKQDKFH